MVQKQDARAKRSKKALLKAGLELLNTNAEATLTDIAIHAAVGRATLYRQYETRENLIIAIAIECLETIDEVTIPINNEATSAINAIELLFDRVMPLTQEFKFLMNLEKLVENDPNIIEINKRQKNEIIEIIEYGKKNNEINKSLPTSWIVNLIEGLFYIGWCQQVEEKFSAQEVAKLAFISFSSGVSYTD